VPLCIALAAQTTTSATDASLAFVVLSLTQIKLVCASAFVNVGEERGKEEKKKTKNAI
jgi:hypothetical protein